MSPQRRPLYSGESLLVAFGALLLTWAVTQTAVTGVTDAHAALAFGALIAFGELLRLNLPGDREAAPIATAGAMAYALLLQVGETTARQRPEQVIAVTGLAMIVGALPHLAAGRQVRLAPMSARLLPVALASAFFRPVADAHYIGSLRWDLPVMIIVVAVSWLLSAAVWALIRARAVGAMFTVALGDHLRALLPLIIATGASALLIAFAAEEMGLAALAVFIAPLLVTQVALRQYAGVTATYLQTVRALARVTEISGYVEPGHSSRVSRLAVGIGRELGVPESALLELEYAALMHDIGQLSLRDPIPGGATVLVVSEHQRRIAECGAEVIQQARVLDTVADIVRRQADPCRPADGSEPPPLSSRIIRAANAFDDVVGDSNDSSLMAAVVDRLRQDTDSEYDPKVVDALGRLVFS